MRVSQAAPIHPTKRIQWCQEWPSKSMGDRIIDALKNELSDIHLYAGDITTNSCAKVNYEMIRQMYAPKHEMTNFHPSFKRLIESKTAMKGPFEMKAKVSKEIEPCDVSQFSVQYNTYLALGYARGFSHPCGISS